MQIPKSGCHWTDRNADILGDCHFEVFFCKMDEIQDECNGAPRKQTKQETIAEGLKAVHNAGAAKNLVGKKFLISRSGKPLHLTSLPTDVLRNFPLPQEFEDELNGGPQNAGGGGSGAFASFASQRTFGANPAAQDDESRRVSMAAKCMFLQLAAAMEVVYADETGDLIIVEVKDQQNPITLVEGVFDSGEHPEGHDRYNISFGLLKDVEA